MNQLELLSAMAKAGFTFGKDSEGTYLVHEDIYEAINKFTSTLWGDRIPYKMIMNKGLPRVEFNMPGYESGYEVYLEDDELDVDRLIAAAFHMYSWI